MTADYTSTYDPDTDFDARYTVATGERIKRSISVGARVLELGCATGLMSSVLADGTIDLLGVDRSPGYLERARTRRLPRAEFQLGNLDALTEGPDGEFDHVLATNVLHELLDPAMFLNAAGARLRRDGSLHLTVQNPYSIHRLCALEMGLIDSLTEISERGRQWGTRTLWTAEELETLGAAAGLRTVLRGGIMLKPLPNALMAELPDAVIDGFVRTSEHLPRHCAMTYLVLQRA